MEFISKKIYILTPFILIIFFFQNCEEHPSLSLSLPTPTKLLTFSQTINQKADSKIVDILMVVDNSGSMEDNQERLSEEFLSFISSIADTNYRIGLITTDVYWPGEGSSGKLALISQTGKRFIEKSDDDPSALFKELVKIGTEGFGSEKPLLAIKMALDNRDTFNEGFFREGADLAIVIVTDEDEADFAEGKTITIPIGRATEPLDQATERYSQYSIGNTYYSAQNLQTDFEIIFGDTKEMVGFVIGNLEVPLKNDEKIATRVIELTTLTNGLFLDIEESFSTGLSDISNHIKQNLIPLNIRVPDSIILDSLVIKITTPDGESFETKHALVSNFLKILPPLPPEKSQIALKYNYLLKD